MGGQRERSQDAQLGVGGQRGHRMHSWGSGVRGHRMHSWESGGQREVMGCTARDPTSISEVCELGRHPSIFTRMCTCSCICMCDRCAHVHTPHTFTHSTHVCTHSTHTYTQYTHAYTTHVNTPHTCTHSTQCKRQEQTMGSGCWVYYCMLFYVAYIISCVHPEGRTDAVGAHLRVLA